MKGYIYKYTFPNGKIYVGQTRTSVNSRYEGHKYGAEHFKTRGAQVVDLAIKKYGKPIIETLEEIEASDDKPTELIKKLNEREKYYINQYDCTTKSGKGYNVQNGGEQFTPEEFILQEAWYEIYNKEKWEYFIYNVRDILDSIIEKNGINDEDGGIIEYNLKSSELTEDERKVWYGIKFKNNVGEETTFNSYIKTYPFGDYISDIIEHAFDEFIEDIRQTIWKRVMKKKDKLIKEFYKK